MSKKVLCLGCFKREATEEQCACGFRSHSTRLFALGTKLFNGRYKIGRELSHDECGITYLGFDEDLRIPVAIREYFPMEIAHRNQDSVVGTTVNSKVHQKAFEYGLNQFLKEARGLTNVDHLNVCKVLEIFKEKGTAYFVTEFNEGISLDEYLETHNKKITERFAINIMLPILDGLKTVHKSGFLHGEINPKNVFLTTKGRPVLVNFGMAKHAIAKQYERLIDDNLPLHYGPSFLPTEVLGYGWHQPGPWTDIYSCGATLYFAVTGEKPPGAPDRQEKDTLVAPEKLEPSISPEFSKALTCALSVRPEDRFQRIKEFQEALIEARNRDSYQRAFSDAAKDFAALVEDIHIEAPLLDNGPSFLDLAAIELLWAMDAQPITKRFRQALTEQLHKPFPDKKIFIEFIHYWIKK